MVKLLALLGAYLALARGDPAHPVDFPANYNTTLYMYAEKHGSTISAVDYRYPTKQALYTTLWAEHEVSRDCSLLFEADGSVWEWYAESKACAKLMEGVGVFPPSMARRAGMTSLVTPPGQPLVSINPFTNTSAAPCNLYCTEDGDGPCYCESLEAPFQPVLHTHTDRNLSGSRSYYSAFILKDAAEPLAKPAYCPPASSAPKFEPNVTGLECSCNRCWHYS